MIPYNNSEKLLANPLKPTQLKKFVYYRHEKVVTSFLEGSAVRMLVSLKVGEVVINPELRTIVGPAGSERLQRRELVILLELMNFAGRLVSLEQLMSCVCDSSLDDAPSDKMIIVYVSRLRKLFERIGLNLPVHNLSSEGFYMDLPPEAGSVMVVFTPSEWEAVKFCVSHAEGRNPGIRLRTGIDRHAVGIKVNERARQDAAVGRVAT